MAKPCCFKNSQQSGSTAAKQIADARRAVAKKTTSPPTNQRKVTRWKRPY